MLAASSLGQCLFRLGLVLSFSHLAAASQLLSFVVPILFWSPGRFGGRLVRPVLPVLLDYFALIL